MKVLFATSEAYPLVKTGGLADVAGALPMALKDLDVDIRVLLPAYPEALDQARGKRTPIPIGDPLGLGDTELIPARMPENGVPLWLLRCGELYERDGGPYAGADGFDWPDNHLRFGLLGRSAALIAIGGAMMEWQPDIVHGNDWQCGLAPLYMRQWGAVWARTVTTIHNIQYEGNFDPALVTELALPPSCLTLDGAEYYGALSFLKAGLVYSDRLTTVSPTYAKEIQAPAKGRGLYGVLAQRSADLTGILNGVDYEVWDSETEGMVANNYRTSRMAPKHRNKTLVQEELGLDVDLDVPLLAVVSRFAEQKGLDLVVAALPEMLARGAQLAVLGRGDAWIEEAFAETVAAHPGRISLTAAHDEPLAHRIIAGADMLLVPSRFEPCGLTQLYAMRYGTVPIVRRTGGLADTVEDIDETTNSTGFVFDEATPSALAGAVDRALAAFGDRQIWHGLQRRGMEADFSWTRSAQAYLALYRSMI